MDRLETQASLEWWANPSTCLANVSVRAVITVTPSGWVATGFIDAPLNGDEREGFELLCELDPLYTLRFPDDSHIDVLVTQTKDGRLQLCEVPDEADSVSGHLISVQAGPAITQPAVTGPFWSVTDSIQTRQTRPNMAAVPVCVPRS